MTIELEGGRVKACFRYRQSRPAVGTAEGRGEDRALEGYDTGFGVGEVSTHPRTGQDSGEAGRRRRSRGTDVRGGQNWE